MTDEEIEDVWKWFDTDTLVQWTGAVLCLSILLF